MNLKFKIKKVSNLLFLLHLIGIDVSETIDFELVLSIYISMLSIKGALSGGMAHAIASSLPFLAQALLFWVGEILVFV